MLKAFSSTFEMQQSVIMIINVSERIVCYFFLFAILKTVDPFAIYFHYYV